MSQDVLNAEPAKVIQYSNHPVTFGHNLIKKKLIRDVELRSIIRYKSSSAEHESGGSRLHSAVQRRNPPTTEKCQVFGGGIRGIFEGP